MTVLKPCLLLGFILVAMSACSTGPKPEAEPETTAAKVEPRPHYKVGEPYKIDGIWYYPEEDYDYDEVGLASWYGPGFHGRLTANGERYNQHAMTAAHKTLPLPSYVRVTNLETGAQVVVRLNDRGPFKEGRIIDLSRQAADRLGMIQSGLVPVRVTLLENESRRLAALLRAGKPSPDAVRATAPVTEEKAPLRRAGSGRIGFADDTGEPTVLGIADAADPLARERSTAVTGRRYYVQAGSFTDVRNAYRLHRDLANLGPTDIRHSRVGDDVFYRVIVGPFISLARAQSALVGSRAAGAPDARLMAEAESPFELSAATGPK